jgi:hypothetical protein
MSSVAVRVSRRVLASFFLASLGLLAACNDNNDVTGTGGALVRLNVDAPDSAVSGQPFNVSLTAQNVGVTNVRSGVVSVTLPSPLTVTSVNAEPGTSATFANSASGATVTWQLNTLDANSSLDLTIQTVGALNAGAPNTPIAIQAQLTADGITPGESVATDTVSLMP